MGYSYDGYENNYTTDDEYGYFIECDIHVPQSIHDTFSACPLFPERIDGKVKATLDDKEKYIDHINENNHLISTAHDIHDYSQAPTKKTIINILYLEQKKSFFSIR